MVVAISSHWSLCFQFFRSVYAVCIGILYFVLTLEGLNNVGTQDKDFDPVKLAKVPVCFKKNTDRPHLRKRNWSIRR